MNWERLKTLHNGTRDAFQPMPPLPINVTLAKGASHIALVRGSVDFILHDNGALAFRKWVSGTLHPDETFFAALNISPNLAMPGAYTGKFIHNSNRCHR